MMQRLAEYDPEIGALMASELKRQRDTLELIASENIASEEVLFACGSPMTNKYAEGYPGKRYYGGCEYVDGVETVAIERARKVFNCEYVNVQPHSGSQANAAVIFAVCDLGDTILSMNLANGGHLSHGSPVNMSGRNYNIISYGTNSDGFIDYDEIRALAKKHNPKLIIAGASAYPRFIDFKAFREIADEVDALLLADIAHIAGLVVAGEHPHPFPHAHIVTTTTHKTMRGPRGGLILSSNDVNAEYNFNRAIFPGTQGGPLMHVIAAKAVAMGEALKPEFHNYQRQIVKNSKALAEAMMNEGFKLVSGGTDNHLMLADLTNIEDLSGKKMQNRCDEVRMTLNRNAIPNDPRKPFVTSGIRLGTPTVTSRGLTEEDMKPIAERLWKVATDFENSKEETLEFVDDICRKHPIYES